MFLIKDYVSYKRLSYKDYVKDYVIKKVGIVLVKRNIYFIVVVKLSNRSIQIFSTLIRELV